MLQDERRTGLVWPREISATNGLHSLLAQWGQVRYVRPIEPFGFPCEGVCTANSSVCLAFCGYFLLPSASSPLCRGRPPLAPSGFSYSPQKGDGSVLSSLTTKGTGPFA